MRCGHTIRATRNASARLRKRFVAAAVVFAVARCPIQLAAAESCAVERDKVAAVRAQLLRHVQAVRNLLVGQIGDSSLQTYQNNAEQLEQQIAILEQRIERLRLEQRF